MEKAPSPPDRWSDDDTERIIGNLLRTGVTVSAAVMAVGGILYLIHFGTLPPQHAVFHGEPADLRSVSGIAQGAAHGHSRALIEAAALLLLATPIARVVFSVYAFARERDRLYVGITLVVLCVLVYSLVWG